MAEVMISCAECGTELEEHKTELKWGGLVVQVIPCPNCLEEVAQREEHGD